MALFKHSFFLCIALSVALFAPALAQAPLQDTLRALPGGEEKPQNLYTALNYIQLIPYSLWILRNPNLWGYVLSVFPTFLSDLPTLFSYLRYYMLQLPGTLSYLLSFITHNLDLWMEMGYNSFCSVLSNPFSTSLKLFVEWPFGLVCPNLPYMCYSVLTSIPHFIGSVDFLISTIPQTLVSYASPTVGAIVSIAPQFIPVFFSFLSSTVDWLNIIIELLPEYSVRLFVDGFMWLPRVSLDFLYSSVRLLTYTMPMLTGAFFDFLINAFRLLPYIFEAFSYLPSFFEELSVMVDASPDFMASLILATTSAISAFVASIPVFCANLVNAALMSIPLCLQSSFKLLFGSIALLLKLPAALLCGVPAYVLSVCSTFAFITLPKEIYHMIRSAISLFIELVGIILSRCFALPCVFCYGLSSVPYTISNYCADLCYSLVEPATQYIASRIPLLCSSLA
ncbi:MAG: hypothetical protein SVE93_04170 [Candidatus Thermoplasmatota archaeon]|nr:hypothetical protein [Candidatus Thermoplasmatota archaeon]